MICARRAPRGAQLVLALLAVAAAVCAQPVANDAAALLELKQAVAGDSNALANWTANTNPCNPATPWVGVTCTGARVTAG